MFRLRLVVVSCVLMIFLGGCVSNDIRTFFPPVDSEVIINQELVSRGGTRVFIQNGQVRARRDVNIGNPHCQFIIRRPRSETGEFIIQPETFSVSRVFREVSRGTTNATMSTFMELASESQPEVSHSVCQRWGNPKLDGFLTIDEMKATLSPIVNLGLAVQ